MEKGVKSMCACILPKHKISRVDLSVTPLSVRRGSVATLTTFDVVTRDVGEWDKAGRPYRRRFAKKRRSLSVGREGERSGLSPRGAAAGSGAAADDLGSSAAAEGVTVIEANFSRASATVANARSPQPARLPTIEASDNDLARVSAAAAAASSSEEEGGEGSGDQQLASFEHTFETASSTPRQGASEVLLPLQEPPGNLGTPYRRFFQRVYGNVLVKLWAKLLILALLAAYIGVSVWGILNIQLGLPFEDLTASDSYLREAYRISQETFDVFVIRSYVVFPEAEAVDPSLFETHRKLKAFNEVISSRDYTQDLLDVMEEFLSSRFASDLQDGNIQLFNQRLSEFAESSVGKNMADMLVFEDGGEGEGNTNTTRRLKAWRWQLFNKNSGDTTSQADYMKRIRDDIATYGGEFGAFAYMPLFVYYETDLTIVETVMINLVGAFCGIIAVSMLMIRGWSSILLVSAMIVSVLTGLFGFMYFAGVQLNILTMILLILSIGFSVDYTVHVAHTFAHCLGRTHDLRVVETLMLMGNPVTHGAVSTWLGILALLWRKEYVLQLFFKMLSLVLAFGLFHGVFVLPVLLSFFGPRAGCEEEGEGGGKPAAAVKQVAQSGPVEDAAAARGSPPAAGGLSILLEGPGQQQDEVVEVGGSPAEADVSGGSQVRRRDKRSPPAGGSQSRSPTASAALRTEESVEESKSKSFSP
eukprot:GHVU01097448.1.p1 GENE.GHVU01097448.1~~GHVU01097448.1.p1  ORF type:complete len:799 (+),score=182.34 GHVU01097448.1:299-2398(+)